MACSPLQGCLTAKLCCGLVEKSSHTHTRNPQIHSSLASSCSLQEGFVSGVLIAPRFQYTCMLSWQALQPVQPIRWGINCWHKGSSNYFFFISLVNRVGIK